MGLAKGFELMEGVIVKLSKNKIVSTRLVEAFTVAHPGCEEDFSIIDYNNLQLLCREYENQSKYHTPTVNNLGELNNAADSLMELLVELKYFAERIINTKQPGSI